MICSNGESLRYTFVVVSGSSSAVERQLPKLDAVGSIPISRSIFLDGPRIWSCPREHDPLTPGVFASLSEQRPSNSA